MPELLVELLSEEIPARMQVRAAEDFKRLMCERLDKAQLTYTDAAAFVTPRRLALVVDGLAERQPDVREERKGPRVGSPESAIQGFLRAAGLESIEAAEVRDTDKGRFYFASRTRPGAPTGDVVTDILGGVLSGFPWPKSMRWGDSTFRWVRPLQNILVNLGGRPVPFSLKIGEDEEQYASAETVGHRFLAPSRLPVRDFTDYQAKLRDARVIVDPAERRARIAAQAERLAAAEGLRVREDPALLDEVTGLVEWPEVMLGRIDVRFMDVPPEVLITAMRAHQKYFSLLTADGRLAPRFVLVANTEAADGGKAIVAGNERVLRARLSDAKFFWDEDRKKSLQERVDKLSERVFHAKLGTDRKRVERMQALATRLANKCGAPSPDFPAFAGFAAYLSKADLTTAMVNEFPELQGTMGRYYALHDEHLDHLTEAQRAELADAIADHYAPQGPSDRCPSAPCSIAVALADKIDTLAGFFAIDERPTGSRDPFALRRAALGVIRIIIENRLDTLELRPIFLRALELYRGIAPDGDRERISGDLLAFLADRLKVHLREQGVRHDLIAAVFGAGGEDNLVRLLARVDALRDFLNTDDGANLLTAYRRASNIVRIEENKDNGRYDGRAEKQLLKEKPEIDLYRALDEARDSIANAVRDKNFGAAMAVLAGLRAPVDAFFDSVTVNCAEPELRVNRLKLLSQIRSALSEVADFSQIEG